jgi:hypothetical protein
MDFGAFNWSMLVIVGPILLAVVIIIAVLRNRVSKEQADKTEAATHDVYDAEDRDHHDEANRSY